MIEKGLFGFWFCLLVVFLPVQPDLAQNFDPAQCLISGSYNLIRLPESKDETSCQQDCVAEPSCHMAVVLRLLNGSTQCLLVNCLNQGPHSHPRDPSAQIHGVYPKVRNDVHRCHDFENMTSYSSCQTGIPRFFYNGTSYRCERFFSGCGSNKNTFHSQEGCGALCNETYRCYRPVEYGQRPPMLFNTDPPASNESHIPNFFFYNVSSWRCEGFHFKGNGSNGNIFETVEQCERLCGDVKDTGDGQSTAITTSQPTVDSVAPTSQPAVDPVFVGFLVSGGILFIIIIIIVIWYCKGRRPSSSGYSPHAD